MDSSSSIEPSRTDEQTLPSIIQNPEGELDSLPGQQKPTLSAEASSGAQYNFLKVSTQSRYCCKICLWLVT